MEQTGFKDRDFLLQGHHVFLLFDQHREQHHLKRRLTRQIGAGWRMVAGSGKHGIECLLIFPSQGPSIPAPRVDFLLDQLRERGKRAAHRS